MRRWATSAITPDRLRGSWLRWRCSSTTARRLGSRYSVVRLMFAAVATAVKAVAAKFGAHPLNPAEFVGGCHPASLNSVSRRAINRRWGCASSIHPRASASAASASASTRWAASNGFEVLIGDGRAGVAEPESDHGEVGVGLRG